MSYQFKITIEEVKEAKSLSFEINNHDDIIQIAEKVRDLEWLNPSDSNAMIIGLKLFSEVVLKNPKDPVFSGIRAPLSELFLSLKKKVKDK